MNNIIKNKITKNYFLMICIPRKVITMLMNKLMMKKIWKMKSLTNKNKI